VEAVSYNLLSAQTEVELKSKEQNKQMLM